MKLLKIIIAILPLTLMFLSFHCRCPFFHAKDPYRNPTNEYIKARTDLDRIQELIDKGEDMNELDRRTGLAPLHAIVDAINGNSVTEDELLNYSEGEKEKKRIDMIDKYYKAAELLLDNGADVNVKTHYGATVLHFCKDARCIKFFLKYGIDVDIGSLLIYAAYKSRVEVVKQLIINGADINTKNSDGETPLFYSRNREISELLIKNGADVKVKNLEGETPLFFSRPPDSIIELMIRRGADVNAKNLEGETALFYADKLERVRLLIKYKIKVNEQDNIGKTVLHHILSKNNAYYSKIISELLKSGARVDIKDNDGKTPLDIASEQLEKSDDLKDIYELMLKYKNKR